MKALSSPARKTAFAVASLGLLVAFSCSTPTIKKATPSSTFVPRLPDSTPVKTVLNQRLTGLQKEAPEEQTRLREEALKFIQLRKQPAHSKLRLQAEATCQTEQRSLFCPLIEPKEKRINRNTSRKKRASVRLVRRQLLTGDLKALAEAGDFEILEALKTISDFKPLRKVASIALETKSCEAPALVTGLGMKAEKSFPDPEYKALSKSLYQNAVQCDHPTSVRAAYRLALISIWEGNCAEAETTMAKYFDHPDSYDYRSRLAYWRFHCAGVMKNSILQGEMKTRLIRDFPLSLHALIVQDRLKDSKDSIVNSEDPLVAFRSLKKPEANAPLLAAEVLQDLGHQDLSFETLFRSLDVLRETETEVRLYASILLLQSGDFITKFNFITGIFREDPRYISASTLEMLYPLKRFEMVRAYESQIDPYLVISLIRQESAFNENARSRAGALGLMQLMPRTARLFERRVSRRELLSPETNVRLGVKLFSVLLEDYQGDPELALAAYNAGSDRVREWLKRYPTDHRLLFLDLMPFKETRDYVASIARNYFWYQHLYLNNRSLSSPEDPSAGEQKRMILTTFKSLETPVSTPAKADSL